MTWTSYFSVYLLKDDKKREPLNFNWLNNFKLEHKYYYFGYGRYVSK